ncbi:methyltransferase domain-containing protein [Candidatus Woesearchaeota archaeon]|nr:methyltransferase domain-containing protein [Candidatus Woesearchaeota archaeon]
MMYYDDIAEGYDELHKEEQLAKLALVKDLDIIGPDDKLLDVGCGTGFSLDYFDVQKATGVDPAQKLIAQYTGNQKILLGSAEALPFDDHSFDVVISITAIQNFDNVRKGLAEMLRVGKERFVLTALKASPKIEQIEKVIDEIFANFNIESIEQDKDIIFSITL